MNPATTQAQALERQRCKRDVAYFIRTYVQILNATDETWRPFDLWPAQAATLEQMRTNRQLIVLKSRQLGLTWLCLAFALWRMVFYPIATIGIFSRREDDATELLDKRLKGMYARLPAYMQSAVTEDNKSTWQLSTGSAAMAFATNGGRGYTFSLVLVDEADYQPDLPGLMASVKPTVDAGGRMWLVSSVDKSKPESRFKAIYRAAKAGNEWRAIFLPWTARPGRTDAWYAAQGAESLATTGALDDLQQEYPASDTEALAPRSLDKRIPAIWIEVCYAEEVGDLPPTAPPIAGLIVYRPPVRGKRYVLGVDPAEGNPTSDDSALTVLDRLTGEEVASLAGKFQPATMGDHAHAVGKYYNNADILVERNNHGHAVILRLMYQNDCRILDGLDDRPGWLSTALGKTILYDNLADSFREHSTTLHSFATYTQIAAIEGSTLRAPPGTHDDRADGYALANVARALSVAREQAEKESNMLVHDENLQISPY